MIGLLAGVTASEQRRQLTRLIRYIEAEQEPESDYSLPKLGPFKRTLDTVNEASSKLNLDSDKMFAAIFWLYLGNSITDEPAFEALKDGNLKQAIDIWLKLTNSGEVTQKNASAFHNLSTIYLFGASADTLFKNENAFQGIYLKLKFLESDFVKDFKSKVVDDTFKITKRELQLQFLKEVLFEFEGAGTVALTKIINLIRNIEFHAKEEFMQQITVKIIEDVERKISDIKLQRKSNKGNASTFGFNLANQTAEIITIIKSISGASNLKYTSLSDKLSDEILQCGIDYFTFHRDQTETKNGIPSNHIAYAGSESMESKANTSLKLFEKADSLAIGHIAKQRCRENTQNLKEWIDNKSERERQARIITDLNAIKEIVEEFGRLIKTVSNGKQLLLTAKQKLENIKAVLGEQDELYLNLSTRIASDSQSMCVAEINNLQDLVSNSTDLTKSLTMLLLLKEKVSEAWEVTNLIGAMDLRQDFRAQYNKNKAALSNLKSQLESSSNSSSRSNAGSRSANISNRSSNTSGGCYIATMAYGNYDHPQVVILRRFRDEVLYKTVSGRYFIKIYYYCSPKLVKKLKNKQTINFVIRKTLDQIIKLIK